MARRQVEEEAASQAAVSGASIRASNLLPHREEDVGANVPPSPENVNGEARNNSVCGVNGEAQSCVASSDDGNARSCVASGDDGKARSCVASGDNSKARERL